MNTQHAAKSTLKSIVRFAIGLALLAGAASLPAPRALAQEPASGHVRPAALEDGAGESKARVNRPLMILGATLFVGSYVPSAAFATLADWNADTALVVPVAGPWMALANPDEKPLSKALLVNSGVMQGVGVLSMVMSLVLPSFEDSTTLRFGNNELKLAPTQLSRDGYGLVAAGRF